MCVSTRLPFAKIFPVHPQNQRKLKGPVINVPCSVDSTQNVLPRFASEMESVTVNLKRKKEYKSVVCSGSVRPVIVFRALDLLKTTPLYIAENVRLRTCAEFAAELAAGDHAAAEIDATPPLPGDTDMNNDGHATEEPTLDEAVPMDVDVCENDDVLQVNCNTVTSCEGVPTGTCCDTDSAVLETPGQLQDENHSGSSGENEEEMVGYQPDTETFWDGDTNAILLQNRILNVAPGEGQMPMNVFKDKFSEELSFTKLFGGHARSEMFAGLSHTMRARFQLKSADRRFAKDHGNIFWNYRMQNMISVCRAADISVKKSQVGQATAGQLMDPFDKDRLVIKNRIK